MVYRLEIMPPGEVEADPLEIFESCLPFPRFAPRDLIDPVWWPEAGEDDIYQVTGVCHQLRHQEDRLMHTLRVYTRRTLKSSSVIADLIR